MKTDEDEGGVEVLVVLFHIVSVKLFGFSAVDGEEVGPGIFGPEGFEELLEGRLETGGLECQRISNYYTGVKWVLRTTWDRFEPSLVPAAVVSSPQARASSSVVIVARQEVWCSITAITTSVTRAPRYSPGGVHSQEKVPLLSLANRDIRGPAPLWLNDQLYVTAIVRAHVDVYV